MHIHFTPTPEKQEQVDLCEIKLSLVQVSQGLLCEKLSSPQVPVQLNSSLFGYYIRNQDLPEEPSKLLGLGMFICSNLRLKIIT